MNMANGTLCKSVARAYPAAMLKNTKAMSNMTSSTAPTTSIPTTRDSLEAVSNSSCSSRNMPYSLASRNNWQMVSTFFELENIAINVAPFLHLRQG